MELSKTATELLVHNDNVKSEETASNTQEPPLRVGVLRKNNTLGKYTTSNLMAYMARNFNIELYFFTVNDFNPEENTINATLIEGNTKTPKIIPLPEIVYDISGTPFKTEGKGILKDKCYFFQYGWTTSKQTIFNLLATDGRFTEFLIETHMLKSFEQFHSLLGRYDNDIILKPDLGSLGKGVVRIIADGQDYNIIFQTEKLSLKSVDELKDYYEKNFVNRSYALQPYIISRTKYGNPFDIRIHVRRGAGGKFNFIPYPRFGRNPEGILSNISAGGYTMPIVKFFKQEYGDD